MNQIIIESIDLPRSLVAYVGLAGLTAFVIWRLFLAYLIMNDADKLFKANRLFLNSNLAWIIATLVFGVFAVLAYWLLHYSILLEKTKGRREKNTVE